jgi:hypothetical protein
VLRTRNWPALAAAVEHAERAVAAAHSRLRTAKTKLATAIEKRAEAAGAVSAECCRIDGAVTRLLAAPAPQIEHVEETARVEYAITR